MVTENTQLCTGCGVCAAVCKKNCITMELNTDGFYMPRLTDPQACTNCGLCDMVCSQHIKPDPVAAKKMVAAFATSDDILNTTSSGGVCYEIARQGLVEDKKICGCVYNYQKHRAEHVVITSVADLEATKGSKYFQSYTADAFSQLFNGDQWIVFGTPCQMASVAEAAKLRKCRDKLLLVDFFCHGTPSRHLWTKYLAEHDGSRVSKIDFRSKEFGWHTWSMRFHYKDGSSAVDYSDNMFYKFFFSNLCLNEACHACSFKAMKSAADIRVGDFWGKKYAENSTGVSSCVAMTQRGFEAVEQLERCCRQLPAEQEDVLEVQMIESPPKKKERKAVMKALKGKRSLKSIYNTTLFLYRVKEVIKYKCRRK